MYSRAIPTYKSPAKDGKTEGGRREPTGMSSNQLIDALRGLQ
ncbi:hypothetical protein HMPREF9134_00498 [Porphyromonas catoniae F0037]|uniref:Uncharacterized protein n=2 Tax=root TaxID=1 RepID=L1NFX1_9PORP|nr:hypothetical protein HMPREF9134_00498 [Porphyromonas catoniae F0037]DAE31340.1 MAG TPA: hypothetical protein [virus sp. ctDJ83]